MLGGALYEEFARYDPAEAFLATSTPALVIHGDADLHISHDIARDVAARRPSTDWRSIPGAGHGFLAPAAAKEVVETTAEWLERHA